MSRILTVILSICQIISLLILQKENTVHLRKPISFIWKVRGKANDKYNLLFFQFSCRSNYTLAILLQFISCQTHPTEKTCRAMRFIFYPVLRVTVRIDMDQYHFIFFAVTYILMHLMKKTWNLQKYNYCFKKSQIQPNIIKC